jgi:hypothetical protein
MVRLVISEMVDWLIGCSGCQKYVSIGLYLEIEIGIEPPIANSDSHFDFDAG